MTTPRLAILAVLIGLLAPLAAGRPPASAPPEPDDEDASLRVLVFSKTTGFRHASIPDGIACFEELAEEHAFSVDATEDAAAFALDNLARYDAVVFLNTTGDVLDDAQQTAFEAWYRDGGGFLGVHSAADTEYDWPWYGRLVGAWFRSHPAIQPARIMVHTRAHPATAHLDESWTRTDEWYDFRSRPGEGVTRLMSLDESTYEGGRMDGDHPIAWCHEFDGGRAIYTAGGHTKESYAEPDFRRHLLGALLWAADVRD